MVQLLEAIWVFLEEKERVGDAEWRAAQPRNLEEDATFFSAMQKFQAQYQDRISVAITNVAEYIRIKAEEFVQFEEADAM